MVISDMKLISFSMTTAQFEARTKTVTRRMNWLNAKDGDHLMGVDKCMGLKPGQKPRRIHEIILIKVRREPLRAMLDNLDYGFAECVKEGFPDGPYRWPSCFVDFFCHGHKGCTPESIVTRLEFEYVPEEPLSKASNQ